MKKKIIILGSTGSIGKQLINLVKNYNTSFKVELLSTNKNVKKIINQAKILNVKNIIIVDSKEFLKAKQKYKKLKLNIFNNFDVIDKLYRANEIFYSMVAIVGIDGLKPTLKLCKCSKNLAIANKESIICAWDLIKKKLDKYKTNFIPIDSEHFSIFTLIKNYKNTEIEKVYITASGGPFINLKKSKFHKINIKQALDHPNWKMGKKISIDSATLMNKVFEVIEARNLFNLKYNEIKILTHPSSYVHAIIKFKNGVIKFLAHQPDMTIPIINSLNISNKDKINIKTNDINLNFLNNLNFKKVDTKKFTFIKLLKKLPNYNSLYETVLITVNDYFVNKFLNQEINFSKMIELINKFLNYREFQQYKRRKPQNIQQIYNLRKYVSFKIKSLGI